MRYVFPIRRAPRLPRRRGFTLIEAATTTVIIGVGCVAMLQLLGAGTMANHQGTESTVALNLAGNVREAMAGLAFTDVTSPTHWGPEAGEAVVKQYNDLDDFDGWSSAPSTPIDAKRDRLPTEYAAWSQQVKVESLNPDNLSTPMAHLTLSPDLRPVSRITVSVFHNGNLIYSESWIATYADKSAPTGP
jgi:type II secretory pathway pseudopilin PulG